MGKLRPDWQTVHQLHSLKKSTDPFAWFPELFNDDLGTVKDVKASISVKPDANPLFCKARTVSYIMKTKVDVEVDLSRVPTSSNQWPSLTHLPMLKSDTHTHTYATQEKSLLGMLTFYLLFLPNLATILQPLHQLLKKGQVFRWGTDQELAFNMAKELLRKNPVLTHYDVNKPLLLTCAASSYGAGAVMAHQTQDKEQPVAFHCRTMAPAEKNYHQVEKKRLRL